MNLSIQPMLFFRAMDPMAYISSDLCKQQDNLNKGFRFLSESIGFNGVFLEILKEFMNLNQVLNSPFDSFSHVNPSQTRQTTRLLQYYLLTSRDSGAVSSEKGQLQELCSVGISLYVGILLNDFWVSSQCEQLLSRLKSSLDRQFLRDSSTKELRLWFVCLACIAVSDSAERPWCLTTLINMILEPRYRDWEDARTVLQSFAWVAEFDDPLLSNLWTEATTFRTVLLLGAFDSDTRLM